MTSVSWGLDASNASQPSAAPPSCARSSYPRTLDSQLYADPLAARECRVDTRPAYDASSRGDLDARADRDVSTRTRCSPR